MTGFRKTRWSSPEAATLAGCLRAFEQGDIGPEELRACRVPLGVYEQRGGRGYMVRVRCPGGVMSPRQLAAAARSSLLHGSGRLHLTTRQELQLHDVALEATVVVVEELHEAGLQTRGTGGNSARNVTASTTPRGHEGFDVAGHALSLSSWLGAQPESSGLPRKLKIAFASSPSDDIGAKLNDLGFVAKRRDGERGFEVWVAAGLGARPRLGHILEPFVPERDVLRVTAAVLRLFFEKGNRGNRNEARLRFLWERLGEVAFREAYRSALLRARGDGVPDLEPLPLPGPALAEIAPVRSDQARRWLARYGVEEHAGLVSALVPVASGELTAADALALADVTSRLGGDALLRFTVTQNALIRYLPLAHVDAVYAALRPRFPLLDAPRLVAESVSCAGASTCQLGICLSHNALEAARRHLLSKSASLDALAGLRIHFSGCPNNCGRHSVADIGFAGKAARAGARLYPAYRVVAGARLGPTPKLARDVGEIPARAVPEFLAAALEQYAAVAANHASFADYFENGGAECLRSLARGLADETDMSDADAWVDWGAEDQFSMEGRGHGECWAG